MKYKKLNIKIMKNKNKRIMKAAQKTKMKKNHNKKQII